MSDLTAHTPPKWEYRILVKQTDRQMLLDLNQFGREGWEAINLSYDKDLKGVMMWTGWLKRPVGVWSESAAAPAPITAAALPAAAAAAAAAPADGAETPVAAETAEPPKPTQIAGFDLPDGDFDLKD
jgi:hypothetical protein